MKKTYPNLSVKVSLVDRKYRRDISFMEYFNIEDVLKSKKQLRSLVRKFINEL
jgi:hypothetical protein